MLTLDEIQSSVNLTDRLDEATLNKIADYVIQGYTVDCESRKEWWELVSKSMDIAKQVWEEKTDPFPKASNVKFPLITQAVIDFASRQYPQIIQNERVVRTTIIGADPDGQKYKKADRVSECMSMQLLDQSCNWEEDTDRLLHVLPMVGTCFKKTYFHTFDDYPVSELCTPEHIIVNNNTKSLELAPRITHEIYLSSNMIKERIMAGIFADIDVDSLYDTEELYSQDLDNPIKLLEQHCFFDLDGDGYREPVIIIAHEKTRQILRVVHRIQEVQMKDGKLLRIIPEQYFTDFHFIRSVDGGYYSIGFGTLLYPLNESINTVINQLLDAGTLNNYQSGFVSSGLRMKNGNLRLNLNEWKVVQVPSGMRIQDAFAPLPTKEPSMTLLNLLQLLIEVGKDLTSTTDIMQGKGQTQNVPATTTLSMIEQGMKVYNAIGKRFFLSLKKELRRVFYLNSRFLPNKMYRNIMDDPNVNVKDDFDVESYDIFPVSDPSMSSQTQKIAKAQAIIALPTADPHEASVFYLEQIGIDQATIDRVLPKPDPNAPPPPETQKTMAETKKLEAEAQKTAMEAQVVPVQTQLDIAKSHQDAEESNSRIMESQGRIGKMAHDAAKGNAEVVLQSREIDQQRELHAHAQQAEQHKLDFQALLKLVDVNEAAKDRGASNNGD